MAEINTSALDDQTIDEILRYGFEVTPSPKWPKYISMRLALNISLNIESHPEKRFDDIEDKHGVGIALKQLTGKGQIEDLDEQHDLNDAIKTLLSAYHNEDLFVDEKRYRVLLQRHIRRGLHEIRSTWKRSHDFASWLNEELLSHIASKNIKSPSEALRSDEKVVDALKEVGIRAEIQKVSKGARINRYFLKLSEIHAFDLLKRSLEKIGFLLGLGDQGVFINATNEPKVIGLDIPRSKQDWKTIDSSGLFSWAAQSHTSQLPVWLGEDVLSNGFSFDLAGAPHLMIAGTTGSGKSISLHALLVSLLKTKKPHELKLALIDPKLVELSQYKDIPNLYGGSIAHDLDDAMDLLEQLVEEMEKRNLLLNEIGVSNVAEAVRLGHSDLPCIVVVIEELADLISQSKEIETPLIRLAQKARSTGIHLVIATQRPDSATFSGLLRSNIPGKIALRVQKGSESRIILDENGAEKLLGAGDMLVKVGDQPVTRIHGAYISQDDIKRTIKDIKKKV